MKMLAGNYSFIAREPHQESITLSACDSKDDIPLTGNGTTFWMHLQKRLDTCNRTDMYFGDDSTALWWMPDRKIGFRVGQDTDFHRMIFCVHYHSHKGEIASETVFSLELEPVRQHPELHEPKRLRSFVSSVSQEVRKEQEVTASQSFDEETVIHPSAFFVHAHFWGMADEHVVIQIRRTNDSIILVDKPHRTRNEVFFVPDQAIAVGQNDSLQITCTYERLGNLPVMLDDG